MGLTSRGGDKTTGRVEREPIERLTTLHHPSVGIHVGSSENERKKESEDGTTKDCRG